ncbi:MAG: metallophosphoesterase [Halolamina sp.]|uniref:metallophosphoesterase n=1 Tax=Halolamina sp. TaxID=1940283 RepID=UPI002FC3A39C
MFVVLSDTHATTGTELGGAAAAAVDDANLVLHAGDFMTEAVLDSFRDVADEFRGVHGNNDDPGVTERLPETTTVEYAGVRIAATHRSRSGTTGLVMFGRQQTADLVVFGHSHRPTVEEMDELTLLNPGSHAEPRGARQSFAVLEPTETGLDGRLVTVEGERFAEFTVEGSVQRDG